jgi:hypothetical protein
MTTNWKIFDTKRQTADGVIIEVTYGCTVQLDNFIDRTIGELTLSGSSSVSGFIPYENLTESIVLGWVQTSLGAEQVTAIETALQNNVTAQKAAKEAETEKTGLPWRAI